MISLLALPKIEWIEETEHGERRMHMTMRSTSSILRGDSILQDNRNATMSHILISLFGIFNLVITSACRQGYEM